MSYVSLARKYRPRRFIDMVGQESTTLALTNAIRLHREPHSVIFTGVRGVGKTTSARIYAKALNCEQGPTAEPCDVCGSCQAIAIGNHEDVLEIDGASNTGIDDVRALQETLGYVPQRSAYKIYIIDEVHMLSISAFNALLKTLEEPPQHVVFIFATTELQKVPETIQSRCQIFHLQKISRPVIAQRVRDILVAEQIPFDEGALTIIAREGRGSMRDALTLLDQVIAMGGGSVRLDALKPILGSTQSLPVLELLEGLLLKDAKKILAVIARWDQAGQAMAQLAEETAKACRNAFILRDLKGEAIDLQILELEDREQHTLKALGEKAGAMDLNRLFRLLAKCLDDLRHADLDRFVLENYCLEWCFDPGLPDLQSLIQLTSVETAPSSQVPARPLTSKPPTDVPLSNLRERLKTTEPLSAKPQAAPVSQRVASSAPAAQHVPPTAAVPSSQLPTSTSAAPQSSQPLAAVPGPASTISSLPATNPALAELMSLGKAELKKDEMPAWLNEAPPMLEPPSWITEEAVAPLKVEAESFLKQMARKAAESPLSTPVIAIEAPQPKDEAAVVFPDSWRDFVEQWKKQKPLQARYLEEAYVLEYSPQRIRLSVEPQSMAGGKLLQPDVGRRLTEQFVQLFGFCGQLEVIAKGDAKAAGQGATALAPPSGESLLDVKQREREASRENLRHRLEEHPMTRELISRFGGTIEQIEIQ